MFLLQHSSAVAEISENWEASGHHILTGRIKERDGLVIVPVKIRFEEAYQFAAGLANVSVTRFAEHSENFEGRLTSDIDRSEARTSNNESLIRWI